MLAVLHWKGGDYTVSSIIRRQHTEKCVRGGQARRPTSTVSQGRLGFCCLLRREKTPEPCSLNSRSHDTFRRYSTLVLLQTTTHRSAREYSYRQLYTVQGCSTKHRNADGIQHTWHSRMKNNGLGCKTESPHEQIL